MKATFKMLIFALATLVCLTMALGSCGGDEDPGASSSSTESSKTESSVSSSVSTSEPTNDSETGSSTPSVESTPSEDSKPTDESEPTDESNPTDESKPTDESNPTDESKPTDSSTPEDKPCTEHKGGAATCTDKAVCTECGEEYGELAEHKYDVKGEVVDPDCENDGYTVYGCSAGECGTTETRDEKPALNHEHTVFVETVEPTCGSYGYEMFKCVRCDDTKKVKNDKAPMGDHDFSEASDAGLIECYECGKVYRDITSVPTEDKEAFCMGCGKDPCECGAINEWTGYTPAEAPFELAADTAFVKTGVQIGYGVIVLTGNSETEYAVEIFFGETSKIIDVSGELVYVYLGEYAEVTKVEITASTDAYAQLYAPAK